MQILISALLLAAQPLVSEECVYDAMPASERVSIGEAVLERRSASVADALKVVTDDCARQHHWSVEQAVHANGYAAMRFAADTIGSKLGHPQWSHNALQEIRKMPTDQVKNLAGTGSGGAEFELVLTRMIANDKSISALHEEGAENLKSFVLMIKLNAVAETERLKI